MLFAFDGTWQRREDQTNVSRFVAGYDGPSRYWDGVGTRWGQFGQALGGLTGMGGRRRVETALRVFEAQLEQTGDEFVDVVGFSRGAALALQFVNALDDKFAFPVRFLGLFDTVAAFGVPFNRVNLGWDLTLPPNVDSCVHAMALDESRPSFQLTRLTGDDPVSADRVREVWFRGAHCDIGGGAGNLGLSCFTLRWMVVQAFKAGLPIHQEAANQVGLQANPMALICRGRRFLPCKRPRTVRLSDKVHESVRVVKDGVNPPLGLSRADDFGQVVGAFGEVG
jgi:uncharacterized protein (DUF2235 family)